MSRTGAIIAIALAWCLAAPAGHASAAPSTTDKLAAHLDHDATFAARVDLEHWQELVEQYKRSGLPGASTTVFTVSAASMALLGFDPLVQAGWFAAGIDANAPVLASTTRVGDVWRTRIVVAVDQPAKLDAAWTRIGRAIPGLHPVEAKNGAAIARGLGRRDPRRLVAELTKSGVRAAGVVPFLDAAVALHRKGDVGIIDIVAPFSPPASKPRLKAPPLVTVVRARPRGIAPLLKTGAAHTLTRPGITFWAHGSRGYDELRRLESWASGTPSSQQPAVCGSFRTITTGGPFVDVAFTTRLRVRPGTTDRLSIHTGVVWGLRGPYKLADAIMLADDGLADVSSLVTNESAAMAGASYLRTLTPLRSLPRPGVLSGPRRDLRWAMTNCGPTAQLTTWLMGWPQLLGRFVDRLANVHPQAETMVAGTRNAVFAVYKASLDRDKLVGFAEASVAASVVPHVERYYALLFGKPTRHKERRSWTTWGSGPLRPYRWNTPGGTPVFGGGFQAKAVDWRMNRTIPNHRRSGRLVVELHIHPSRLLNQLLPTAPWLRVFRALAGRMQHPLSMQTQFSRDTLETFASVVIR